MPSTAIELIKPGETAVVVFTKGLHLNYDGSIQKGESGKWKVSPYLLDPVTKIIIYLRDPETLVNCVLMGSYSGYEPSGLSDRYVFFFRDLHIIGLTDSNWIEFGRGSQNPVCVIGN
jgi:hypothetical protein